METEKPRFEQGSIEKEYEGFQVETAGDATFGNLSNKGRQTFVSGNLHVGPNSVRILQMKNSKSHNYLYYYFFKNVVQGGGGRETNHKMLHAN